MLNWIEFALAIALAVIWRLFHDAHVLYRGLTSTHKAVIQDDIIVRRKAFCPSCRLYFAPLSTCDSPFYAKRWPNGEPEGCLCHIPTKAGTSCNCPLYDKTRGVEGWPRELNSFPL